jgi:hypothetical protein
MTYRASSQLLAVIDILQEISSFLLGDPAACRDNSAVIGLDRCSIYWWEGKEKCDGRYVRGPVARNL